MSTALLVVGFRRADRTQQNDNNEQPSVPFSPAGIPPAASPVSPQPGAHLWSHRRARAFAPAVDGSRGRGGGRGMTCRNY